MSGQETEDDPPFEVVFDQVRDAWFSEVHTCFPARVDSYDAASQTANLTPMVRRSMPNTEGNLSVESYPALRAVRVAWLRAGAAFIHMPLRRGHDVHVHCCERDFSAWAQTGDVGDPHHEQTHHLTNALCVPGFSPRPRALSDVPTDAVVIGWDGGATVRIYEDGTIKVGSSSWAGGPSALKGATENVLDHLAQIAASLDEIRTLIALGTPTVDPHYGAAARLVLNGSKPIPAVKVSIQ